MLFRSVQNVLNFMGKLLVLRFERFLMGFSQPEKLAYQNWAMCTCAYGPISLNFELHHTCFIICSSCTHCKLSNAPLMTKFGVVVQELHSRNTFGPYVGISRDLGVQPCAYGPLYLSLKLLHTCFMICSSYVDTVSFQMHQIGRAHV